MASHILVGGLLLAFALAALERLSHARRPGAADWPVFARPVLTEAERAFYARLRTAVPQYSVLCQVQIGQFVEVRDRGRRREVRNRYDRLTADFVVCADDFRVLLVIELDDSSHDQSAQRIRDGKKDAVLCAAGIPVVRFRGLVTAERIREDVLRALRGPDQRTGGAEDVSGAGRRLPYISGF